MIRRLSVILASAFLLAACTDLEVGDLNNPKIEDFQQNPTRNKVGAAAIGLILGNRVDWAEANGYVSLVGILGRESYNFDPADPRYVNEMLKGDALNPGSPRFGGNFWAVPYRNIAAANLLLDVLASGKEIHDFTAEHREATNGFAKTMQALDYLMVINTRDTNGAVIAMRGKEDVTEPDPIEPDKAVVFNYIATLLDEGANHLASGGDSFPFALPSGFAGFDTPATFRQFNRAIKARVDVYRQNWADVLTALNESFINTDANTPGFLDIGVYHTYANGPGDALNGLVNPSLYVHPSVVTDAEVTDTGQKDARVARKTRPLEDPVSHPREPITVHHRFVVKNTSPASIIRNEELLLLRAEANAQLGDLFAAQGDLNLVRVESGRLDTTTIGSKQEAIDEVLYNRRYSLLFEGGHRWVDLRRYNLLDDPALLAADDHKVHKNFPIPTDETNAQP